MKISIWQQFSSNHSARFTIIGRFTDEHVAQKLFEKLTEIAKSIQAWRQAHPDWIDKQRKKHSTELTPPEYKIAEQFDIEWERSLDWLNDDPSENIVLFKNDIFVRVNFKTWNPPDPMQNLLNAMGATTTVSSNDIEFPLKVSLSYTLPSKGGQDIYEKVKIYLYAQQRGFRRWLYVPWGDGDADNSYQFTAYGEATRTTDGMECEIEFARLGFGLPPMLKWLEEQGCTDIQYRFEDSS